MPMFADFRLSTDLGRPPSGYGSGYVDSGGLPGGDDLDFMWRFVKAGHRCVPNYTPLAEYRAVSASNVATEEQLTADYDRLVLGTYAVWKHYSRDHPSVIRRGLAFGKLYGDMLLRHGRAGEARFHLWRWWLARPFELRPAWLLLRSLWRR